MTTGPLLFVMAGTTPTANESGIINILGVSYSVAVTPIGSAELSAASYLGAVISPSITSFDGTKYGSSWAGPVMYMHTSQWVPAKLLTSTTNFGLSTTFTVADPSFTSGVNFTAVSAYNDGTTQIIGPATATLATGVTSVIYSATFGTGFTTGVACPSGATLTTGTSAGARVGLGCIQQSTSYSTLASASLQTVVAGMLQWLFGTYSGGGNGSAPYNAIDVTPSLGAAFSGPDGLEQDAAVAASFSTALGVTTGEPPLVDGSTGVRIWYKVTTTDPGAIVAWVTTASGGAYSAGVELLQGLTTDSLSSLDDGSSYTNGLSDEVNKAVSVSTYYLRAWPKAAAADGLLNVRLIERPSSVTLQWAATSTSSFVIDRTPYPTQVNVLNGTPGATVTMSVDGTPVGAGVVGALGLVSIGVALPAVAPGTYFLDYAESAGGSQNGSLTFTTNFGPRSTPTPGTGDSFGTAPVPGAWTFMDGTGQLATYVLPNNPTKMTSPFTGRVYSNKSVTAPRGNLITFEGAPKPAQWQVSGTALTEGFVESLEMWLALTHRFMVVDHHGRGWSVSLEGLDAQPTKDNTKPWAMAFTLSFLIFDGPYTITYAGM